MRKLVENKTLIFSLIFLGVFMVTSGVLALEVSWPSSPGGTSLTDNSTITDIVKYFYEWGISLGGLAAFISLLTAGFQYLTSAGEPAKMSEAKDRINSAILGLVLLLSSYLLLKTINPELTTLKLPELEPPEEYLPPETIEPPNLNQSCDKVYVFRLPEYITPPQPLVILKDTTEENIYISRQSGSIKIVYTENNEEKTGGYCAVELYKYSDCSDSKPMYALYSSQPNISQLYLTSDIQCIKVK